MKKITVNATEYIKEDNGRCYQMVDGKKKRITNALFCEMEKMAAVSALEFSNLTMRLGDLEDRVWYAVGVHEEKEWEGKEYTDLWYDLYDEGCEIDETEEYAGCILGVIDETRTLSADKIAARISKIESIVEKYEVTVFNKTAVDFADFDAFTAEKPATPSDKYNFTQIVTNGLLRHRNWCHQENDSRRNAGRTDFIKSTNIEYSAKEAIDAIAVAHSIGEIKELVANFKRAIAEAQSDQINDTVFKNEKIKSAEETATQNVDAEETATQNVDAEETATQNVDAEAVKAAAKDRNRARVTTDITDSKSVASLLMSDIADGTIKTGRDAITRIFAEAAEAVFVAFDCCDDNIMRKLDGESVTLNDREQLAYYALKAIEYIEESYQLYPNDAMFESAIKKFASGNNKMTAVEQKAIELLALAEQVWCIVAKLSSPIASCRIQNVEGLETAHKQAWQSLPTLQTAKQVSVDHRSTRFGNRMEE